LRSFSFFLLREHVTGDVIVKTIEGERASE
jgi:hypothetical protein